MTAVKQATGNIHTCCKRVKERDESETLGRAGCFLCNREIRLLRQDCTSSVAQCNSLRIKGVMEKMLHARQLLCDSTKDMYLVCPLPSLISPETK